MARTLPDRRTKFLSRRDRLEANLNRPSDIDQKIKAALPDLWLPMVGEDTPIILDLSDLAKPLAKKTCLPAGRPGCWREDRTSPKG